jgi:hypothetical protein
MSTNYNLVGSFTNGNLQTINFSLVLTVTDATNVTTVVNGTIDGNSVGILAINNYLGNDNVFVPFPIVANEYFTTDGLAFLDATDTISYNFHLNGGNATVTGTDTPQTLNQTLTLTQTCVLNITKILTPKGEIMIQDLKNGDLIISEDGKERKIKNIINIPSETNVKKRPHKIPSGHFGAKNDLYLSAGHAFKIGNEFVKPSSVKNNKYSINLKQPPLEELNKLEIYNMQDVKYMHLELDYKEGDRYTNSYIAEGVVVESYGNDNLKNI